MICKLCARFCLTNKVMLEKTLAKIYVHKSWLFAHCKNIVYFIQPIIISFFRWKVFTWSFILLVALSNYYIIWGHWWLFWPTFIVSIPCQTIQKYMKKIKPAICYSIRHFGTFLDDVKYVFRSTKRMAKVWNGKSC